MLVYITRYLPKTLPFATSSNVPWQMPMSTTQGTLLDMLTVKTYACVHA